jgi:hypothetical protein
MGLYYKDNKRVQKGIDNKANLEGKNYAGYLNIAIRNDFDIDTIKRLIERGADPGLPSADNNFSPLMEAAEKGNVPIMRVLIEKGADVNYDGKAGSIFTNEKIKLTTDAVKLLIANKADKDLVRKGIPLHMRSGVDTIVNILDYVQPYKEENDFSFYQEYIQSNSFGLDRDEKISADLKKLLKYKFNVNKYSKSEQDFPLYSASYWCMPKTADVLISAGANVNQKTGIKPATVYGFTALMGVVMQSDTVCGGKENRIKMIEYLISKKADINMVTTNGKKTALIFAIQNADVDIVKLLLDKKADPQIVDQDGKKALDYTNDEAIIALLKQKGA